MLPKSLDSSKLVTNFKIKDIFLKKHVSTVLLSSSVLIYAKYKVNLKCLTKSSLDNTNNRNRPMCATTRIVLNYHHKIND